MLLFAKQYTDFNLFMEIAVGAVFVLVVAVYFFLYFFIKFNKNTF